MAMTQRDFESRDWNEGETACRWKFEFNGGFAEAGEERMKLNEIKFMVSMPDAFRTCPHGIEGSRMFPEVEIWLSGTLMRKPDFCVLTPQQIAEAEGNGRPVPGFVIEVVSPNDRSTYHDQKLIDYFASGVQVVWHVNPRLEMITIFTSPHEGEIMHGDDVCSAAPAFPKFKMKASDIFAAAKL